MLRVITVTTSPFTDSGSTLGRPDANTPTCSNSNASDETFEFTAPAAGTYVFDTVGSAYDTVLYALDACGGAELDCNDDAGFDLTSQITLDLLAGETVIIVVDGFAVDSGDYVLNVQ